MTEVHRIRLFDYTPSPIVSVSLNNELVDGLLLVARSNGYIEIWNITENVFLVASLYVTMNENIVSALWCKYRDRASIVVAQFSGELILIDYPSFEFRNPISSGSNDNIYALAVNRDLDTIAIACNKKESTGFVSIYSTKDDLTLIGKSDDFFSKVLSVCFDDNGNIFAGTSLGEIGRIDPDGRIVTRYEANYSSSSTPCAIFALTAVPGGCFASGDSRGEVMIWNPDNATVVEQFHSHQAEIKALASNNLYLWASGVDPKIATFIYSKKHDSWARIGTKTRMHNHEVTCLTSAGDDLSYCISGSKDTTFFIKKVIYPFQAPLPVSSSIRYNTSSKDPQTTTEEEEEVAEAKDEKESSLPSNGPLIVAGASGDHQLTIWKLDGKVAKLELTLKLNVENEENFVECVAMCPGGNELAYSASSVRVLKYIENKNWSFDNTITRYPSASSLTYSNGGVLYIGLIDGRLFSVTRTEPESNGNENESASSSDENLNIQENSTKLDFPILKLAVSSNGKFVAAGGLTKIYILDAIKLEKICEIPPFGRTPFSTFAFQPFKNRLFIANGGNTIFCFNVMKQRFLDKLQLNFEKSGEDVAINTISFSENNNHQMLISSSQRAIVRNIKHPSTKPYRLPYNDILYVTFSGYKKIIIFEKPWVFIVNSVPDVLRVKRFLTKKEEDKPRYI